MQDLVQAGITVEPFFISTEDKTFDPSKFYSVSTTETSGSFYGSRAQQSVFQATNIIDSDELGDSSVLPESISIGRIDELLDQMRFHEVPKRAQFTTTLTLASGFVIGVKG